MTESCLEVWPAQHFGRGFPYLIACLLSHLALISEAYPLCPSGVSSSMRISSCMRTLLRRRADGFTVTVACLQGLLSCPFRSTTATPTPSVRDGTAAHHLAAGTTSHLSQHPPKQPGIRPISIHLDVKNMDSGGPFSPDGTGVATPTSNGGLRMVAISRKPVD